MIYCKYKLEELHIILSLLISLLNLVLISSVKYYEVFYFNIYLLNSSDHLYLLH
jgi:hypothetical protein